MSETAATPSSPPPRRAQLELLVRRDDEGFDVRQIGSATAFVQSRPKRVADDSWELAEVRLAGGRPARLLPQEHDAPIASCC